MDVLLESHKIPAALLSLDDLGWDHAGDVGDIRITVVLAVAELAMLGEEVHTEYRDALAEDPHYFDQEEDLVPENAAVFTQHPQLLAAYITHPVWSRFLILRILGRSVSNVQPCYFLQNFLGMTVSPGSVSMMFGAIKSR